MIHMMTECEWQDQSQTLFLRQVYSEGIVLNGRLNGRDGIIVRYDVHVADDRAVTLKSDRSIEQFKIDDVLHTYASERLAILAFSDRGHRT